VSHVAGQLPVGKDGDVGASGTTGKSELGTKIAHNAAVSENVKRAPAHTNSLEMKGATGKHARAW
tara:strand:- start:37 stop:231 length:195 start_codon:yes stop_codon:yes gene_type:complete